MNLGVQKDQAAVLKQGRLFRETDDIQKKKKKKRGATKAKAGGADQAWSE